MILNLAKKQDEERAIARLEWLIIHEKKIEIKEIRKKRSLAQNGYLQLLFMWFALEYGETKDYVKEEIFKRGINADIFRTEYVNPVTGNKRVNWKSTADLDTKEMSTCIDRFRDYASKEAGIFLPEPTNQDFLDHIQNEINRNKQWL